MKFIKKVLAPAVIAALLFNASAAQSMLSNAGFASPSILANVSAASLSLSQTGAAPLQLSQAGVASAQSLVDNQSVFDVRASADRSTPGSLVVQSVLNNAGDSPLTCNILLAAYVGGRLFSVDAVIETIPPEDSISVTNTLTGLPEENAYSAKIMYWDEKYAPLCEAINVANLPPSFGSVAVRERMNFNQGWKFIRENVPAAVSPAYDRAEFEKWESVDLPHTVRVEPFVNSSKNYRGQATYVKYFPLSEEYEGKKLFVEFEGVMGVTDVWVNGDMTSSKLATATGSNTNYGGFLPFVIDISEAIKCDGTDNIIVVMTDNRDNSLVPPGTSQQWLDFSYFGGIYRNVWLIATSDVHITDALFEDIAGGGGIVFNTAEATATSATVDVKTHVRNEGKDNAFVTLKTELYDDNGRKVANTQSSQTIEADSDHSFSDEMIIENPSLWSLDAPNMHTLISTVVVDGVDTDRVETRVGIRTLRLVNNSLMINGVRAPVLSGVNRHQEYAYVGFAMSDALTRRDVIKLKSASINAVRTGHYPASPAFVAACDELGILLLEPTPGWQFYDPSQTFRDRVSNNIRQQIRRDRNHPSMLCYEISLNETSYGSMPGGGTNAEKEARFDAESLSVALLEKPDIIYSISSGTSVRDSLTGASGGFYREYGDYMWAQDGDFDGSGRVERSPDGFYPGGEARMVKQTRERMWEGGGQGHLLPLIASYRSNPPSSLGGAQWTGIDHNRGSHPVSAVCGMLDLNRIPKYSYYAYCAQRGLEYNELLETRGVTTGPIVFIASNWTKTVPEFDKPGARPFSLGTDNLRIIDVYSNAASVKLSVIVGGQPVWEATQTPSIFAANGGSTALLDSPPFIFNDVPYYENSVLEALGFDAAGSKIAEHTVATAGVPAKIVLEADTDGVPFTADGSDLLGVIAYVVDANGNVCSDASDLIEFSVTGGASIIGDGDKRIASNPVRAQAGVIGALLQSTYDSGEITVTASAFGLDTGSVTIESIPMTVKAATFTRLPEGSPDQGSMYLCLKEAMPTGTVTSNTTVTIAGQSYPYSITLGGPTSSVDYYLNSNYERLTAKVGVSGTDSSRAVIFKLYLDGVLRYMSPVIKAGETADVDINVALIDQVTLVAVDDKSAGSSGAATWLSAYVYEGSTADIDESDVRQNLALGKEASASASDSGGVPGGEPGGDPGGDPNNTPGAANDGDLNTIWVSPEFTDDFPYWQVDLGGVYDVRNALVCVQYDSMLYSYEIYTSPENSTWTKQYVGSKTAHGNQNMDLFAAAGVRYVKVVFTDVQAVGMDYGRRASLREFEIYKDLGVDSAAEFCLKGILVGGSDIVFNPNNTVYSVEKTGISADAVIKVLPYDKYAEVSINGVKVQNAVGITQMKDAVDVPVTLIKGANVFEITVSAVNGVGAKTYLLTIDSDGGATYNAVDCYTGVNGANGWWYMEQNRTTRALTVLKDSDRTTLYGEPAWRGSETWMLAGPLGIHPGNSFNAVKAFIAPEAGIVSITGRAQLTPGQTGDVLIRVYKNDVQIWPTPPSNGALISGTAIATISGLYDVVEAGDQIRFVIDCNTSNGGDATLFDTTVAYVDLDLGDVIAFSIEGDDVISGYEGLTLQGSLRAVLELDSGVTLRGVPCDWSITPPVTGISIDETGKITINSSVAATTFNVQATSLDNASLSAVFAVEVVRIERPDRTEIPVAESDTFGTPPYNTAWGTEYWRAFDDNLGTFYDGYNGLVESYVGAFIGSDQPVYAISLYPRPDQVGRLNGVKIQGGDLIDDPWTTLHTVSGATQGVWSTITFAEPVEYNYYRVLKDSGDLYLNVAEVKFYRKLTQYQRFTVTGDTEITGWIGDVLTSQYSAEGETDGGQIISGADCIWSIVPPTDGVSVNATGLVTVGVGVGEVEFKVCAVLRDNDFFSDEMSVQVKREAKPDKVEIVIDLAKTFGSAPYNPAWGTEYDKAFTDNLTTFYDGYTEQEGGYVGAFIGATPVCAISLYPRDSFVRRLNGSKIQGSNSIDGGWVTLHTINNAKEGEWYTVNFDPQQTYQYYMLIHDPGDVLNVASIKFFTKIE